MRVENVPARSGVVGVVGAGVMGRGIAQLFACSGFDVLLFDIVPGQAQGAVASIGGIIDRDVLKGRSTAQAAGDAKRRLQAVAGLEAFAGADLAIEAIVEDLHAKQQLFGTLEGIVPRHCIIATNTSSMLVTAIAASARHPERICGLHFFNPVPLMKVAEIIGGARTSPEVMAKVIGMVKSTGHAAVVAADMPGFLINHAGRGLYTEGLRIAAEGIAPADEVDFVMREGAGFRMGPFELFDLTGLDVSFKVLTQIYHGFFEEPRFRPQPLLARQHAARLYGRKVGKGFYDYHEGKPVRPPRGAPARVDDRPLWLGPPDCRHAARLRERLGSLGIPLSGGAEPERDCVIIVAPVGHDATTAALHGGFDPERTLAVDPVFCERGHLTVMTTAVTRKAYRDNLWGRLAAAGVPVTVIHDSPGFIAQRMVATIVNVACDIAQQRIASPTDIELGVRLGLGYPAGPLALGDSLGARTVLDILERMYDFYRDPRYRPSPWLKRRALLGRSLLTEEA